MLRAEGVVPERKTALKKLLVFFDEIDLLDPKSIQWGRMLYERNNKNYEMLLNVCYFILAGMLQTTEKGDYKINTKYFYKLYYI